jgi:UDP-N-acetylmuramoyl-L-alanine---L-glutamate ligase
VAIRLSDLSGQKVGIWGAGREGLAATRALSRMPNPPAIVVAASEITEAQAEAVRAISPQVRLAASPNPEKELARCDVVIRSPGVSIYTDAFAEVVSAGVAVTTGTNLWFAEQPAVTSVGITGTKGKSTTAALTAHILGRRFRVTLAGNIGVPLLDTLDDVAESDVFVIELSSHQVSDLELRPTISVVLNLYPEHLPWHGSRERYYHDKLRLLEGDTLAIASYASPSVREMIAARGIDVTWFDAPESIHAADDGIWQKDVHLYPVDALSLLGLHNRSNAAAALTVATSLGVDPSTLGEELADFKPLRHRLERLGEFAGRIFVDDSISTTPESTLAALDALEASEIVLLAGGTDRSQDYGALASRLVADPRVRAVIALPETGERLLAVLRSNPGDHDVRLVRADTVEEAVGRAVEISARGAMVLLSPAAPSYGVYRDFEERGERFAYAARQTTAEGRG